jgi:hypothetical protein
VAGPESQATGRSEFEDGLGSGDFVSGYSYHMKANGLAMLKTPVPSNLSTEVKKHRDVGTWMGDRLMGLCSFYLQGKRLISCWPGVARRAGVVSREAMIQTCGYTS